MSLHRQLLARAEAQNPVRVGLIGAGKFGSMFLAQAARTPGLHVVGVADLSPDRAKASLARVGWAAERYAAASAEDAQRTGMTFVTDDAIGLIEAGRLDVIVEATGHPAAGLAHAALALDHGRHVVMVNVEADVLAGPLLARRARSLGLVYSLAYGDQPALIAELVDWARTCGFTVAAAGKGTKYLPAYHSSTPETVWGHYGFSQAQVASGDFNPRMFNSFLDGTKSAIEMAAVANSCGLTPPEDGLAFPPCGADDLADMLRPRAEGGVLEAKGMVEVVSSLTREGAPVARDLRWGVYVVIEGPDDYVRRCFADYGLRTDASGRYAATYKPYHLIGLELGVSVASAALRGEATGAAQGFAGDAVAVAKRALSPGETLDGEGGFTVWGKLIPAARSLSLGALPIGLAHGVRLKRAAVQGEILRWADVEIDAGDATVKLRREMEAMA
ncbi:MAG: flagellar biosynthesis protein FlgA [Pseudomonadota bacterium]|nr:flagellar biosynthesis protein FlgA [Pseudomonadota bacterium]